MLDIADYLEQNGVSSVYVGFEPPSPDNCVVLYEYAGRQIECLYKTNLEIPSLQVLVRDGDYENGYNRLVRIKELLHGLRVAINGTPYFVYANQTPEFLGRDENARVSWVLNFTVVRERR